MTKFYYSSPNCCREMQADAKLHHPPEWDVQRRDLPETGLKRTLTCSINVSSPDKTDHTLLDGLIAHITPCVRRVERIVGLGF